MKNVKDENIEPKMLEEINKYWRIKLYHFFQKVVSGEGIALVDPKKLVMDIFLVI